MSKVRAIQTRQLDFRLHIREASESGEFSGLASVFNVPVPSYQEIVLPGAFAETIKRHESAGTMPTVLYQHNIREPIGRITQLEETDEGLAFTGKLSLGVQRGNETHILMRDEVITTVSIGFMPVSWRRDEPEKGWIAHEEVDLWEISPVTFAAQAEAKIQQVRAAMIAGGTPSKRDLEAVLRDAGFSKREALAIVAEGYGGIVERRDDASGLDHLRQLVQVIQS